MRRLPASVPVLFLPLLLLGTPGLSAEPLPGTLPLEANEPEARADGILDGAHRFVERKIREAGGAPTLFPPAAGAREEAIRASRENLRRKLGVVDERSAPAMEFFTDSPPAFDGALQGIPVVKGPGFTVHQVRWNVLPGFVAEGLYVDPDPESGIEAEAPGLVYLPDAGETPEDVLGLTARLPAEQQGALRFAAAGFRLVIPATLDRAAFRGHDEPDPKLERADMSRREWIYRQAFQMGRHPLGYEIQAALAAADWLRTRRTSSVTLTGYGEGGRVALYATAIDESIDYGFVSGAFGPRGDAWSEPIDRSIFGLLPDHGDAGVAALIAPRTLLVEQTAFPEREDFKGRIETPSAEAVEAELREAARVFGGGLLGGISLDGADFPPGLLYHSVDGSARVDFPSLAGFLQAIGIERMVDRVPPVALLIDERPDFDPEPRQLRLLSGMERHVQARVDASQSTREERFLFAAEPGLRPGRWSVEPEHPALDPSGFLAAAADHRETFDREILGRFDEPLPPPNPRSRLLLENEQWTAWEVVLDVYPEMPAWGVLLVPRDMEPDERRPAVVCLHGRNGLPRDTIDADNPAYGNFAARLAEQGYVTFSPFQLYRGEDRYRWLDRKANLVGATLFTFLADTHRQVLRWLETLPEVERERIGLYGLSYGGETTLRVSAALEDYAVVVCSGDFNHWTRKVADPDFPKTFARTIEWEMPTWNMGSTFDHGDIAALVFPRPFFVERGHHDGVSTDRWVAFEYARVRRLYGLFGMPERTGIHFFRGGHSVRGDEAFDFVRRHLGDPRP